MKRARYYVDYDRRFIDPNTPGDEGSEHRTLRCALAQLNRVQEVHSRARVIDRRTGEIVTGGAK